MKIKKGQKIDFKIPEASGEIYKAEVHLVGASINANRTIKVHGHFEDESDRLELVEQAIRQTPSCSVQYKNQDSKKQKNVAKPLSERFCGLSELGGYPGEYFPGWTFTQKEAPHEFTKARYNICKPVYRTICLSCPCTNRIRRQQPYNERVGRS
jgi:hypothetical protein